LTSYQTPKSGVKSLASRGARSQGHRRIVRGPDSGASAPPARGVGRFEVGRLWPRRSRLSRRKTPR